MIVPVLCFAPSINLPSSSEDVPINEHDISILENSSNKSIYKKCEEFLFRCGDGNNFLNSWD